MKVTKELANITPACGCRGYIEEGDRLETVDGRDGTSGAWWVACPDCGNALGRAMRYPINKALQALKQRQPVKA